MKKKTSKLITFALIGIMGTTAISAQEIHQKVDTSIFPKAEKGITQFVIEVPFGGIESDNNKKVEVIVGKYQQIDKCNHFFLSGTMDKKDLKGFDYNYYEFKTKGDVAGTLMGCGETGSVTKFVSAAPIIIDYNGRMPIVVYVPEGYEVKYKIYKAEPDLYNALQTRSKSK